MSKKRQATCLLIFMVAGMLLTAGKNGFLINLLHNGFLAAMIGGLADWFAVTALFRKPLGISWRTAILPRNRNRIMDELINFISNDLLNFNNIMKDIVRYDMGKMLADYLTQKGGKERLYATLTALCSELIKNMNIAVIVSVVQNTARKDEDKLYKQTIISILNKIITSDQFDILMKAAGVFCQKVLSDKKMQTMLQNVIHDIKDEYKSGSALREMAIAMLDLSDENITQDVLGKISVFINNWNNAQNEQKEKLQEWLKNIWLVNLQQDDKYDAIFVAVYHTIKEKTDFIQFSDNYWHKLQSDKQKQKNLLAKINEIVDRQLIIFINDKNKQQIFDTWFKDKIGMLVKKSAPFLLTMIKDKLNSYSTEEFTALVENHISNDLQMIRINGSLVGGMAGIVLYILTYAAERLCN